MPDHVHLACSIPPSLSIADAVKRLKGSSSHRLNQSTFAAGDVTFGWQSEYGVYSFTERVLPDVVAYIQNQEARHAADDLWSGFEQTGSQDSTQLPPETGT
jgi:putative transposase